LSEAPGLTKPVTVSCSPSPTGDGPIEASVVWALLLHAGSSPSPTGDGPIEAIFGARRSISSAASPSPTGDGPIEATPSGARGGKTCCSLRRQQATAH